MFLKCVIDTGVPTARFVLDKGIALDALRSWGTTDLFSGAAVAFTLRADELPQAEGHPRQADGAQTAATPEAQGQGGPLGKRNIKT